MAVTLLAVDPLWLQSASLVFIAAIIAWLLVAYLKTRARNKTLELAARQQAAASAAQGDTMNPSDRVLFEQHKRINDLTIAKLEADVALLKGQVDDRVHEEDRLHASKEYHELMVEKARLEIDSLRLHIAEQRRRMEDWRSDH